MNLPALLDRISYRFPAHMIDRVVTHTRGQQMVALKSVSISEDYFQGHFPHTPLMPAVLMVEALTQVAAVLVLERDGAPPQARVWLRGVNNAKFRRQVVPGDTLRLEVTLGRCRPRLAKAAATAFVDEHVVAEAELLLGIAPDVAFVDPLATVMPGAEIGAGSVVGPNCWIGPNVRIGRNCRIGASVVIDGVTSIGDGTEIFPMASIGMAPQDLKYKGEPTRLTIGQRNVFREFVTINRGTAGGGGATTIGDGNLFMAYVHVAHDCHVGNQTIFGPHATLGGHVTVEDFANISAGSAVHQFCRIGRYGFVGGYSVVTKDALPFAKTIGSRPARIFGVNSIGLIRRGFTADTIAQLRRAYRYLVQSKLNTTSAIEAIERDPTLVAPEVKYMVDFIRGAARGVILRRPARRGDDAAVDE